MFKVIRTEKFQADLSLCGAEGWMMRVEDLGTLVEGNGHASDAAG